jgi:hypothetical protein
VVVLRQPALLQARLGLQSLNAALAALDLALGAVEEEGYKGGNLGAERGFSGGEGCLGNELVVLICCCVG